MIYVYDMIHVDMLSMNYVRSNRITKADGVMLIAILYFTYI